MNQFNVIENNERMYHRRLQHIFSIYFMFIYKIRHSVTTDMHRTLMDLMHDPDTW